MPSKQTPAIIGKPPAEEKKLDTLLSQARELKITDEEGKKEATAFLSNLNKINDKITNEKEKVTKPLNAALSAERARWKPAETKLAEAIALVRRVLTDYQTAAVKKQREDEDAIVNRVGEGRGKLSAETAVKKMEAIQAPDQVVTTEAGAVQFRAVQKFEVMDITMLPKEYLLPNETKIREAMKNGVVVPGIRYYEEQVPYNTR